ncbi:D-2-hydroxyacid dehydrogenase [Luteitalea sp. TBR-22]|uniref:D-2-hydroxyacid dehydrogenase n=1 Tax=Luteitalea sp. TBR-22 TaxID=2802971 RepID=UPI001EF5DE3D|nr:D-2-hydroxyacid dehydrogenase [Luteitalea sp. TBR-22]
MLPFRLLLGPTLACALVVPLLAQPDDARVARLVAELGLREAAQPLSAQPGWTAPRRILVRDLTPERRAWLQPAAPGVELVGAGSFSEARDAAREVDAVLGFCEDDVLAGGPRIRWVQTYNAGVERCLASPIFRERGILLTNMQRIAGPVMAEHVMALVLAHARGLPGYIVAQREGRWARGGAPGTPGLPSLPGGDQPAQALTGRTMLVVGYGGIGSEVARRAHAFGMTVIAIRNTPGPLPDGVSRMGLSGDLLAFARDADVIVDTLPLTADTRGMMGAAFFAAVKKGAFFVNVGRGGTVDTEAMTKALQEGRLGGAGLDVTAPEPLPAGHPLWSMPNVILTPHVAADSEIDEDIRWHLVRENLRRYVSGGRMLSVVDPARGY